MNILRIKKFGKLHYWKLKLQQAAFEKFGLVNRKVVEIIFIKRRFRIVKGSVYSKPEKDSAWVFELAKNAKIVYDVGVNTGQSALLMLYNDNIEKLVLVEPNHDALSIATENLIRNNFIHKTITFSAFASNKVDEKVQFWSFYGDASGSIHSNLATTAKFSNQYQMVPTTTLDFIFKYTKLLPDLIKMDIEGAELMALEGSKTIASHQSTYFIIEMHSFPGLSNKEFAQKLINWCRENDYKAWYLKNKLEITNPAVTEGKNRYHVLLLPKNIEFPDYLKQIEEGQAIWS